MPEMTNIRGQNFKKPKKNKYDCTKCRACLKDCLACDDGNNYKPYMPLQKEGEKK
jgi:hypothetical protein